MLLAAAAFTLVALASGVPPSVHLAPSAPTPKEAVPAESRLLQDIRLQDIRFPPRYVVLANEDVVPDTWVVKEFELYFGYCYQENRIEARLPMVLSSGTRPEDKASTAEKAVDWLLHTNWTAQCKMAMEGCKPHDAFIGLDVSSTAIYAAGSGVNVSDDLFDAARVKCVRFFQSELPQHRTNRIAVREAQSGSSASPSDFVTAILLEDCAAGVWSRRPAWKNTMWRVTNLEATVSRWSVSELEFYEDILCQWKLEGAGVFSSGSAKPYEHGEFYAFDRNLTSKWVAGCTYEGCHPLEAYIGIDLSETPRFVRCIRIYQTLHNTNLLVSEKPAFSRGLGLDRWDGTKWLNAERFWDPKWLPNVLPTNLQTLDTPFLGIGPGVWEDTRTANRSAWRLTNDGYTAAAWKVHEVEFYATDACEGKPLIGEPLSMQGPSGLAEVSYAFDGDTVQDDVRQWSSSCLGFSGRCIPQEAWLGMYIRSRQPDIRCFRLLQSRTQRFQASSVELSSWQDGQWARHSIHRDVGGGGWNRRPSPPWTMWRVSNLQPVDMQWRVAELRGFSDPYCLFELERGHPISSGFLGVFADNFLNAFDAAGDTSWGADCNPCNKTGYWLGMEMPASSAVNTNSSGLYFLRCVRIWQSHRFEEQARQLRPQVWDGSEWVISPGVGDFPSGGGGQWTRHPASHMSKWRLRPAHWHDSFWRLRDLELYSSSDCLSGTRLRMPWTGQGGAAVVLSGYQRELTGYKLTEALGGYTGDAIFSEALRGMDGDLASTVRLVHQPSGDEHAWFGVDYLSEITWVRCVRIQQGSLAPEQAPALYLEAWDGKNWSNADVELSPRILKLEGLGGDGWHRRPAADKTLWRLENLVRAREGWAVYEIEFHSTANCAAEGSGSSSLMEGEPISSGHAPAEWHHNGPTSAFDGFPTTAWVSQCSFVEALMRPEGLELPPPGCEPGEAWIGLDIGLQPQQVRCVRILQVGYRPMQSSSVGVSKWDGSKWSLMWRLDGLGGSSWNQRPAVPNSMWRISLRQAKQKKCRGQLSRSFMRSWGVAELGLFADDACTLQLGGGRPISSGSIEFFIRSAQDPDSYALEQAFDGLEDTAWAANCNLGWRESHSSEVDCHHEWLGLDFVGAAMEVRCVKLLQSRLETPSCCDLAEDLELQRWNGTGWGEASWRHEPGLGSSEAYRWLGAQFKLMGACPPDSYSGPYRDAKVWQQRARRDSDSCLVPLSTGVGLLADPSCVEHPRCAFGFGVEGRCCPLGDGSESGSSESRCCCNFLTGERNNEPIFVDEVDTNELREMLGVERAVIITSDFLPYAGMVMTTVLYVLALALPPDASARARKWLRKHPRCWRKAAVVLAGPALMWRDFLAVGDSLVALLCCWCCLPGRMRPRPMQLPRFFIFLAVGTFTVAVLPWLGLGLVFGWLFLKISLLVCVVVRWTKSPYDPKNPWQMRLRQAATGQPILGEEDTAQGIHVAADFMACIILGFVYFLKFIFDLLLARAQMISYDAVLPIETHRVIDIFPGLMSTLREPAMYLYWLMYHASLIISYVINFFVGLPRCEGATSLISCVALVMVLVAVTQWLNYDFFGLFAAGRQAVKTTRPTCQRILLQGLVMFCFSLVFAATQCAVVLFTRALNMANPFKFQMWMCEWPDTFTVYLGRTLLGATSLIGLVFVFLCVNGHFMGQEYVIKPVGRLLDLDLEELDPGGGFFRYDVFGSALPTVFGVWVDWWNVNAFLVKKRARVYAQELGEPQPCKRCKEVHVKYSNMMCATGRMVGLACQILPYGILIGKASEYFNDPPLCYYGAELACCRLPPAPSEPRPVLGKKKCALRTLLFFADLCSILLEYGVPILRRIVALAMYAAILAGTFWISDENLVDFGSTLVLTGFYLAFLKAAGEGFLETTLSFTIGLIYKAIHEAEGTSATQGYVPRTVAGQALVGSATASIVAVITPAAGWASAFWGSLLGFVIGYPVSIMTLVANLALEEKIIPGRPRKVSSFRTLAKLVLSLAVGLLIGLVSSWVCPLRGVIGVVVVITAIQAVALKLVLVDQRPGIDPFDPQFVDHGWRDSPTFVALGSIHFLPGIIAVPSGAIAGGYAGEWIVGDYSDVVALIFTSLPFGVFAGVIVALTVNKMLDEYPQLLGSFSGLMTFSLVALWNAMFAVGIGAFVGASVGSVLEMRVLEERIQDELLQLEQEALIRAQEAELRERKGLEPIIDEWTTDAQMETLELRERRGSTLNRITRMASATGRALQNLPIASGLACETRGDMLVLPDGRRLPIDAALQYVSNGYSSELSALENATPALENDQPGPTSPLDSSNVLDDGGRLPTTDADALRELADVEASPPLPPAEPAVLQTDVPSTGKSQLALEDRWGETNDSASQGSVGLGSNSPEKTRAASRESSSQVLALPGKSPEHPGRQRSHSSTPASRGQYSQSTGSEGRQALAIVEDTIVDNFRLDRSDDPPTAPRQESLPRAPDDDDDKIFGRWDQVPGTAPRVRSEPRRVQHVGPKVAKARRAPAPPPAQATSFRDDFRLQGTRR